MMKQILLFIFIFFTFSIYAQITTTVTASTSGVGVWTPCGITSATIICHGAGGSGGIGGASNGNAGGGGGGGAYTVNNGITVVSGTSYNYTVGAGGTCPASITNGIAGGATNIIIGSTTVTANGGAGGAVGPNGAGGVGGTGTFSGGNGAAGVGATGNAGGGGEAASSTGAGNLAVGSLGGTGTAGADGGAGSVGNFGAGTNGVAPGGGGGGSTKNFCGGNGGDGQITILYTNPSYAGANQTLANCATTATLAATALPAGWSGNWSCVSNCAGISITTPTSPTSGVTGLSPGYTALLQWVTTYSSGCTITTTVNITSPLGSPCSTVVPTNNACASAIPLTLGTQVSGTTLNSTNDIYAGAGSCTNVGNVWYSFTTPSGTQPCYTLQEEWVNSTCNDMIITTGCSASSIGVNTSPNIYNDYSSTENSTAFLPSTTYYISLGSTTQGPFTFILSAKSTAVNDQCSGAQAIGTTPVQTDNAAAGCEYTYVAAQDANVAPATLCASSLENVSWFGFTASSTGTVTITLSNILCNNGGGGFQTGLITGSCSTYTIGTTGAAVCIAAASGTVTYSIPGATAGKTYLIGMDGNAGSDCHFSISGTNVSPLPIELTMFNANLNGSSVDLSWATATEINNDYFTVERSADGVNFESIGFVKGAGNSVKEVYYYLQDRKPLIGISYYRLKQTDFDKKESYSVIQSISIDAKNTFDFMLFPNPSDKNEDIRLVFNGKENDVLNLSITDITGKLLSEKNIKLSASSQEVNLKHHFDAGIYFVKVSNKDGKIINQKFIIQ